MGIGNSVYEVPEVKRMLYLVHPESICFLPPLPVLFLMNPSSISSRQIEIFSVFSFLYYTNGSILYILFYSFIFWYNNCIGGLSIPLHKMFILFCL